MGQFARIVPWNGEGIKNLRPRIKYAVFGGLLCRVAPHNDSLDDLTVMPSTSSGNNFVTVV